LPAKEPAFKTIEMKATMTLSGLDSVNASYQTPYGLVKSRWKKQLGLLEWNITVPPNSKAVVYLPVTNPGNVKESGKVIQANAGIKYLGESKGNVMVEIGSGDYDFKLKN
jgi:alpha-L-rhamnosidase